MTTDISKVPEEVMQAMLLSTLSYVGADTYLKIRATHKRYPEYFKWENTYYNIPQEVHNAFLEERQNMHQSIFSDKVNPNWETGEFTKTKLEEMMQYIFVDLKIKEKEYEKRVKILWDKYYKPFNLKYRK